jgi:hypothetical protein
MPLMTVSAILGGVIKGFLWIFVKNINIDKFRKVFIGIISSLIIFSIFNHVMVSYYPSNYWVSLLNMLGKNKNYVVYGIDSIALIGLVFYLINVLIVRATKDEGIHFNFLKLTMVIGTAGLIVTTMNTFILRAYISKQGICFSVYSQVS